MLFFSFTSRKQSLSYFQINCTEFLLRSKGLLCMKLIYRQYHKVRQLKKRNPYFFFSIFAFLRIFSLSALLTSHTWELQTAMLQSTRPLPRVKLEVFNLVRGVIINTTHFYQILIHLLNPGFELRSRKISSLNFQYLSCIWFAVVNLSQV